MFSFLSLFHPHLHIHLSSTHLFTLHVTSLPSFLLLSLPPLLSFSVSHSFSRILSLFYLFFPPLQPCVAVLRGTLCCPQPLSAVLRVLLLWLRLFLSSSTTTTLYYPPLPTSWQVHTLCTTCLPACLSHLKTLLSLYACQKLKLYPRRLISVYQFFWLSIYHY